MRAALLLSIIFLASGCGDKPATVAQTADTPKAAHVKITQFYAPDKMIPRGLKGSLCYGVENASKVDLNPPAEVLWPSSARCFEIAPKVKTTYTLSAYGSDGAKETKSVDVTVGAAPPRLYDVWASSVDIPRGLEVKICFKAENVTSVKVHPGAIDGTGHCMTDRPSKTTVYKITALGGDREMDSSTVTVKVHDR